MVGAGEPGEPEGGPLDGDGRVAAGKVDDGFTDGPGESAGPRDDGGIQLDQRLTSTPTTPPGCAARLLPTCATSA